MAMTTISVRVTTEERDYVKKLGQELNLNQTDFIRKLISDYSSGSVTSNQTIKDKAVGVVEKSRSISDYSHPLLTLIEQKTLVPLDDEGNEIAKIETLTDLLDFVQKNVFRNG